MGGSGASLPAGGARVCKKRVELGGRERKRGGWFVRGERWGGTTKMVSFPIRAQARVVTGALSLFSGVCVWGSEKTRKEGVCVVAGGGGESHGPFFWDWGSRPPRRRRHRNDERFAARPRDHLTPRSTARSRGPTEVVCARAAGLRDGRVGGEAKLQGRKALRVWCRQRAGARAQNAAPPGLNQSTLKNRPKNAPY
jgi:hypothetical protein